jgi:hypothetical protein
VRFEFQPCIKQRRWKPVHFVVIFCGNKYRVSAKGYVRDCKVLFGTMLSSESCGSLEF